MKKKPKLKTGPKPKPQCAKGHDTSLTGRTPSGNCKQCQSDYYKSRWQFIKDNYPKINP